MLDDINAECTNHRTCRYLVNVMQVIRRVMTSFYTLFSQEERNCHNISIHQSCFFCGMPVRKTLRKKTTHVFSGVAIDQAHEQNNASVKGDGGAVGLTENPAALRRWKVSGPEMAHLIGEFEVSTMKRKKTDFRHHEQTKHAQMTFGRDIRDFADPAVIDTLRQMKSLGQEHYDNYVNERLVNQTKPITYPIKRNNPPLFSRPPVLDKSRAQLQRSSLKNDCSLFSRLHIASQIRSGDLDQFFQHENQAYPPALSQMVKLRTGTKSDLVGCLEDLVPTQDLSPTPVVQVILLDGAAIVNTLRPGFAKTFSDYASQVFLPYITSQLQHVNRLDIV